MITDFLYSVKLSFYNNKQPVIQDLSFTLSSQQSLAIMGVNGAGKSTLLKIIMGLIPGYEGACYLQGLAPLDAKSRWRVAYIPEKIEIPRNITGLDYLKLYLTMHDRTTDQQHIDYYSQELNLDKKCLNYKIATFSKGMQQKLLLLGAFLIQPRLMIIDEVMSGLDMITRGQVRRLLNVYRDQGGAVLFTTHLLEDIQSFATDLLVLHRGQVVLQKPLSEQDKDLSSTTLHSKLSKLLIL